MVIRWTLFTFLLSITNTHIIMAQEKITQTAGRTTLGDFAPKFAELNDETLFGDMWNRTGLSPRDRSMIYHRHPYWQGYHRLLAYASLAICQV